MHSRLKGLQRIALVYTAVKHAHALSLEQAASSLREAESLIDQQKAQALRLTVEGRAALQAGEHIDWQLHEAQKQVSEQNVGALVELRMRRETVVLEATEVYRAARLQLEQMESVQRELRANLDQERTHRLQRESDDRFLSRRWWDARSSRKNGVEVERVGERMKAG